MFVVSSLTYFIKHKFLSVHMYSSMCQICLPFWHNNILLHVYTTLCFSIYLLVDTWVASSLGYCENIAMNTGLYFCKFLPFDHLCGYSKVDFLDHIIILFLIFWGTATLISVMITFYILTNSEESFHFFTSSPIIVVFYYFKSSNTNECEVIAHCAFDL